MIINSLVSYYDQLVQHHEIAQPGWSVAKVSFGIALDRDGNLAGIISRKKTNEKGKEVVSQEQIPERVEKTSGIYASFLSGTSAYLLGVVPKINASDDAERQQKQKKRAEECFQASSELHSRILKNLNNSNAKRIVRFFEKWDPGKAYDNELIRGHISDFGKTGFLIFTDEQGRAIYEDPEIRKAWQAYKQEEKAGGEKLLCLDTGTLEVPAVTHPRIKGLSGAQPAGASLVSFNKDKSAYESYGKKEAQGLNAPISEETAFKYTTVLNKLIADKKNIQYFGSKTNLAVIFWAEEANHACEDLFSDMVSESNEMTDEMLREVYKQLSQGGTFNWKGLEGSYDNLFYILGVSPNAARLSIRFFLQGKFGNAVSNLYAHMERLKIVQPFDQHKSLPLWKLLQETIRPKSRNDKVSVQLEEQLLKSIILGRKYPFELWTSILSRIRAEKSLGYSNWEKAAILKAYILNNMQSQPEVVEVATMGLNQESNNEAYLLGRLFAVLESLQKRSAAPTKLNVTIKDRFFASAAANPGIIFPQLLRLAQNHERKLDTGIKVYYDKMISELLGKMQPSFPKSMNLVDQGVFYLGYYHQKENMFTKKEED